MHRSWRRCGLWYGAGECSKNGIHVLRRCWLGCRLWCGWWSNRARLLHNRSAVSSSATIGLTAFLGRYHPLLKQVLWWIAGRCRHACWHRSLEWSIALAFRMSLGAVRVSMLGNCRLFTLGRCGHLGSCCRTRISSRLGLQLLHYSSRECLAFLPDDDQIVKLRLLIIRYTLEYVLHQGRHELHHSLDGRRVRSWLTTTSEVVYNVCASIPVAFGAGRFGHPLADNRVDHEEGAEFVGGWTAFER